ncbi:MAG: hypothetical protein K5705_11175 [Oscillospiraceae bacterium]|nr:hypothetical protein [Oscillospiraceae bacterium]MCR4760807.1 hypothetical protein [Oscillospiraceae bacterium]
MDQDTIFEADVRFRVSRRRKNGLIALAFIGAVACYLLSSFGPMGTGNKLVTTLFYLFLSLIPTLALLADTLYKRSRSRQIRMYLTRQAICGIYHDGTSFAIPLDKLERIEVVNRKRIQLLGPEGMYAVNDVQNAEAFADCTMEQIAALYGYQIPAEAPAAAQIPEKQLNSEDSLNALEHMLQTGNITQAQFNAQMGLADPQLAAAEQPSDGEKTFLHLPE